MNASLYRASVEPENRPLRILYTHHAATFGGASRSLMELIAALPDASVQAHVIVPRGAVARALRGQGVPVLEAPGIAQFDCTRYGYYRGLRWLIVLREALLLPGTLLALRRARSMWPAIDLVHVNDTTQAYCIWWAARRLRLPVVIHARALLAGTRAPRRMQWFARFLQRHAAAVIAIDGNVEATLPPGLPVHVIHNGFAQGLAEKGPTHPLLAKLAPNRLKVAMVGSLAPMKGAYEFVEAARLLASKRLDIDFVLVGEDIRPMNGLRGWIVRRLGFSRPVRQELEATIEQYGLQDRVHLLGFISEIKSVYDAIDILCFPSHLDAPGRPVFEAAFSGVPSIVAARRPTADTFVDGVTGVCIPARDAGALAAAIERLYHDRMELHRMGNAARQLAIRNFDIRRNAAAVLDIYRRLASKPDIEQ